MFAQIWIESFEFSRKERKGRKERIGKMKELIMVLGCAAAVALAAQAGTKEENCLFTYPLTGHYRMKQ